MEKETDKRVITLTDVQNHPMVIDCIRQADQNLKAMGFTEHGFRHTDMVANTAHRVLTQLGYSQREAELAAIAGYMHDLGNVVERSHHYYTGALIAMDILQELGMDKMDITEVAAAIGNHDEINGHPVSICSAAVILADKADVHRMRVRNPNFIKFDIHDRVNYAVEESALELFPEERVVTLNLKIDNNISTVLEYFEIFLSRMVLCRRAANFLSANFSLVINDAKLL